MSEPRMPSPFQKFRGGIAGRFEISGDYPSVSDEQRRQLLKELLQKMFNQSGWTDITVTFIGYNQLDTLAMSAAVARYSQIRIELTVPEFVDATGKTVVKLNVPPTGDWGLVVLQRTLAFMERWIQGLPARP